MSVTDDLIAQALHAPAPWPDGMDADSIVVQATYHGVTAVLISRAAHLVGWPEGVRARLKAEALAQTRGLLPEGAE